MTELVSEYLECLGLEYSKRVFDAESGAEELASRRDRAALARDMGVAPPRDEATPLLAAALGEGARGEPKAVGAAPKPPSPPSPHRDQAPVAGNIIVSDDSDSADIETDVDIDYSDAGTSTQKRASGTDSRAVDRGRPNDAAAKSVVVVESAREPVAHVRCITSTCITSIPCLSFSERFGGFVPSAGCVAYRGRNAAILRVTFCQRAL